MTIEKYHAWIYPGAPATNASNEYKVNKIDVLRVEYFTINENGGLDMLLENPRDLEGTCNAFSQHNIADIKAYSSEQLVTISCGNIESLRKLFTTPTHVIRTLNAFVNQWNLTGIDIDFEGIGSWTNVDYTSFKQFIKQLGDLLHIYHKKLAVCTPVWSNVPPNRLPPFQFNYNDFISLPIDYVTPMIYDYQFDMGAGTPVQPIAWVKEWIQFLLPLFGKDKLVIGIPSYGYTGTLGLWDIKIQTKEQIIAAGKYDVNKRSVDDMEIINIVGNKVWVSNDTISLRAKRTTCEKLGITQLSVWHLGGNSWF